MRLVDDYVDRYVDRNMEHLMEEWQLTTTRDITDIKRRISALEREIDPLAEFEVHASEKLTELEARLKKIKEGLQ
ncbi:MAG: hypothetical protein HXS46_01720 [Theionarchaea archaeon]|nr:MAG: hypothetical protein AYK18_03930 [Theionarchaea archaeon DG-70]MBU7009380.1 hypothetical protein [Theionarchaea archaeon]